MFLRPPHSQALIRRRGFSLIELMVTLSVAALLMVAAVPAMQSWIANSKVRTAAEAFQNAARLSQAEAIRRSRTAVVALTNDAPGLDAKPTDDGQRWFVRVLERSTQDDGEDSLYLRGGTEPEANGVTVVGDALTCFNALGQQTTIASGDTGLEVGCTKPADSSADKAYVFSRDGARTLKVLIGLGGKVRLCDAEKTFSDSQPDGCPSDAS